MLGYDFEKLKLYKLFENKSDMDLNKHKTIF